MFYHLKGLGVPIYAASADVDATVTYDQLPGDLFPGMSSDGVDITIPIASLADYGLTAAHCAIGSGDARQLAHCMTARIKDWYVALPTAQQPLALTVSVRRSVGIASGDFPYIPKDEYRLGFYLDWPNKVVADEP